jgi:hypothetical protein
MKTIRDRLEDIALSMLERAVKARRGNLPKESAWRNLVNVRFYKKTICNESGYKEASVTMANVEWKSGTETEDMEILLSHLENRVFEMGLVSIFTGDSIFGDGICGRVYRIEI